MEWRLVTKIAALAISVPTTAVLLYWLFLRKDTDEEYEDEAGRSGTNVRTSRETVIQVTVPGKAVGTVIGQKGVTIKKIQEETGARVRFSERETDLEQEKEADRAVIIRGDCDSAQKAEVMIRQIVADMPVMLTEEVLVPVYCIGRIIGKGGETIRHMSRSSRCKISIDRSQDSLGPEVPRVVSVTGTAMDITIAKTMIGDKVNEEEEFRSKMTLKGANREQRKKGEETKDRKPLTSRVAVPPEACWGERGDDGEGRVVMGGVPGAEPVREFMEVFVSAVEHADHFWLQTVNRAALNLDSLTDDMSLFYSDHNNAQKYQAKDVKVGDVVAAPFSADNMWYRARVEGFVDGKADLYYFDFGDNELIELDSLRELKPEHLSLPVQAIECKLANVKPVGDEWSEESCEVFEDLTHCAEWRILSARTVGYQTLPCGNRPCVQLVDNLAPQPVDVAAEMVARGLAMWETTDTTTTTTTSPPTNTTTTDSDTVITSASDTATTDSDTTITATSNTTVINTADNTTNTTTDDTTNTTTTDIETNTTTTTTTTTATTTTSITTAAAVDTVRPEPVPDPSHS